MTAAETNKEQAVQAEQNRPNPPQIQGRVDAIENDRIYGWVWDAANTGDRLAVQVLVDGRRVATVVADRPRIDLRRNGIGDGAYSFDIPLPPEARASPDGVTVVAVSPSDGSQTVLRRPTADERAAEAAIATPMARVMEKLDWLVAAQRQIAVGQRDATVVLRDTASRLDRLASTEGELGEALSLLRGGQKELTSRVEALEVFLVRFDATLKSFDERLVALDSRNRSSVGPHFLLLAALLGFVGGMLIAVITGV